MNLLRPLITARLDESGGIRLRIDLVHVDENSNVLKNEDGLPVIEFGEDVLLGPKAVAAGTGYVSQIGFADGQCELPPFFIDAQGRRHFVVQAETKDMNLFGQEAKLKKSRAIAAGG